MAPQAETFGTTLRRLRDEHGLTADDLSQLVREAGERVSVQSITAWERGEYGPGNRQVVQTIDDCLNAGGTLVAFMRGTPKPTRVDLLEQRVRAIEGQVQELSALVNQALPRRGRSR